MLRTSLAAMMMAAVAVAQTQWTVKPDGTGDFVDVASAVAAVSAGDIVLIYDGSYGAVTVTKSLTLLGDRSGPRPTFSTLTFSGAGAFQASYLAPNHVVVDDVPGRSSLDDVVTGGASLQGTFDVARSEIVAPGTFGAHAVVAGDTALPTGPRRLRVVDSLLRGGDGDGFFDYSVYVPGVGGDALRCLFADVFVVGSTLVGGDAENGSRLLGVGGAGIAAAFSTVEVRGSAYDVVSGGSIYAAPVVTGPAVYGDGVTICDVTLIGPVVGTVTGVGARPFLLITGDGGPGGTRNVELYGPAGLCHVGSVAFSLGSAYDGGWAATHTTALEIDPMQIFTILPLTPQGPDVAASITIPMPDTPALAGLTVYAQAIEAAFCDVPTTWWLTNPVTMHLTF
jgi:hypothetical protein